MPYYIYRPSDQPGLQRLAGEDLRARIMQKFKEVSQWQKDIENHIESLKLFLENEFQRCNEKSSSLNNLDSLHEK